MHQYLTEAKSCVLQTKPCAQFEFHFFTHCTLHYLIFTPNTITVGEVGHRKHTSKYHVT